MLNSVCIQGRICKDIELKTIKETSAVSNVIAWSEKYKDREQKLFLPFELWGRQAEFLHKYFKKGSPIIMQGKIVTEEYEKDGQKHSLIKLRVENIDFCGDTNTGNSEQSQTPKAKDDGVIYQAKEDDLPF